MVPMYKLMLGALEKNMSCVKSPFSTGVARTDFKRSKVRSNG